MPSLNSINKSFGEKEVIRDFSYTFPDTGIYALTGKSGSGKTTLLRIMAGLEKSFDGSMEGFGRSRTSICFQEHRLFPRLSALKNLTEVSFVEDIPRDVRRKSAEDMLIRLGFSSSDMLLTPASLSGGMRQRVALARAILRDTPVLLLDEATKELDSALRDTVLSMISEQAKKRLVIMVTHREDEIAALGAVRIPIEE